MKTLQISSLTLFLLLSHLCPVSVALAQPSSRISVDQHRPLAYAAAALSKQLGVTITFEEMEFEHPDDFQTAESRSGTAVVTKFGEFAFEYDPARPVSEIVDSLLDDYHQSFPGKYRVVEETLEIDERSSTVFHIVPDASKDITGAYVPRRSVLDVPVSVHFDHPAHVDTILCEVLQQASKLQDTAIYCLPDFAHFYLGLVLYEYHAENVPVRTLLLRLLNETGHHLSWNVNRASTKRDYGVVFYSVANGL